MIKNLDEFKVYGLSMQLGEDVWEIVSRWNSFAKNAMGLQLVKAADSIASNLSEGLGRYHYKDVRNFSYFSRGSLFETKTWVTKSFNRRLIDEEKFRRLSDQGEIIGRMINSYIRTLGPNDKFTA